MPYKTLHIVQSFERQSKKLIAGQPRQMKTTAEAIGRAERDAGRFAGVVALTQVVDEDTGEVVEDVVILARHGDLPAEFKAEE